jgi:hypothetical protein
MWGGKSIPPDLQSSETGSQWQGWPGRQLIKQRVIRNDRFADVDSRFSGMIYGMRQDDTHNEHVRGTPSICHARDFAVTRQLEIIGCGTTAGRWLRLNLALATTNSRIRGKRREGEEQEQDEFIH